MSADGLLPAGANDQVRGVDVEIELQKVPVSEIVSGTPRQGTAELGTLGGAELGIWELRDGTVTDTEVDEFFVVLSGEAVIEFLDEPGTGSAPRSITVRAGDVVRLVAGVRTRWTVRDHIRKVYITPGE